MHGKDAAPNLLSFPDSSVALAASAICDDLTRLLFRWSVLVVVGLLPAVAVAVPPPNDRVDGDRRNDAALRDIFFADPDRGWAVGDLGTILVTSDGGNVWVPQSSGTSGNLQSVYFSTATRGFAAGGWYESDTGLGRAILLRTTDGGETWAAVETDLPPLRSIHQLAGGSLIASGEWSPIHLGAVFISDDEGVSWRAVGGEQIRQVTAASLGPDGALVADGQGVLFSTLQTSATAPATPEAVAVLPGVCALASAGPHAAAALADRTFAISRDGGRQWAWLDPREALKRTGGDARAGVANPADAAERTATPGYTGPENPGQQNPGQQNRGQQNPVQQNPVQQNPVQQNPGQQNPVEQNPVQQNPRQQNPGRSALLPLCAAAAADGSLWLGGAPGRHVWRVDPQGVFSEHETGFDGPLYALHFHDQHRGWAVGGFGTILATRDGGRTWRVQRAGAARAMLLGVAVAPAELPWPVLASESLELGNRFLVAVDRSSPGSQAAAPAGDAAIGRPSGFNPLRESLGGRTGQVAARLGGGEVLQWNAAEKSSESIAAVIASAAPSVIILGADVSDEQRDRWVAEAVRAGVARVFEVSRDSRAELTIHASAVLPVAGMLTADLWSDALALLDPRRPVPERLWLRRRWDESRAERLAGGVSDGLPSGGGRRPVPDGRRRNFQILQARSGESQLVERLVEDARTLDRRALERQLSLLVSQTPPENRERLLRKLLHRIESGREHRASEVRLYRAALAAAASQPTESGFARAADLRLQSLLWSDEWAPLLADSATARDLLPEGTTERVAAHRSPFEKYDSPVTPASLEPPAGLDGGGLAGGLVATQQGNDAGGADGAITLLGAEDLAWQMHPAVLLWKSAHGPAAMTSWDRGAVTRLGEALSAGLWKDLLNPLPEDQLAAIPAIQAGRSERPLLDGRVDDPCWGDFAAVAVEAAGGEPQVRFAYDSEFLYFALRGSFGALDQARPAERRQRDSELVGETRAVLEIDVDRDLLTAYELTVDARGRTRDTCDGFTAWQPMWYVATELEGGVRTIEAAVRRQDLVGLPPVAGDRWRIRARILPGGQSTARAPLAEPDGWRTLVFE